jgi:hypothetical protein
LGYLAPPPDPAVPVVVHKDVGGLVTDYQARTEQYRRENREVRLHECRSACTLALSLPNVCVYPGSVLKFHKAYDKNTKIADEGVSAALFNSYPPAVQARLGTLTREYRNLSGSELISLGVRNCNENPIMLARRMEQRQRQQTALAYAPQDSVGDRIGKALTSLFDRPEPDRLRAVRTVRVTPPAPALARVEPLSPFADAPLPPRRPATLVAETPAPPAAAAPEPPPVFTPPALRLMDGAQPMLPGYFVIGLAPKV